MPEPDRRLAGAPGVLKARPVIALAVALLIVSAGCDSTPTAPEATGSVEAGWGEASVTARRDGWGAVAAVTVEDLEDDGDCVYARLRLVVTGGFGAEETTAQVCGTGEKLTEQIDLRPGEEGTAIESVRLQVLRDRNSLLAPDEQVEAVVALPQMRAAASEREAAETLAHMTAPITAFEAAREGAPGPWDWNSDGCSVPDFIPALLVAGYEDLFLDTCHRHDFGYRNYGRRFIEPTDQRREWIDGVFREDMRTVCGSVTGLEQQACLQAAEAFYLAVRNFGGRAFYGP